MQRSKSAVPFLQDESVHLVLENAENVEYENFKRRPSLWIQIMIMQYKMLKLLWKLMRTISGLDWLEKLIEYWKRKYVNFGTNHTSY